MKRMFVFIGVFMGVSVAAAQDFTSLAEKVFSEDIATPEMVLELRDGTRLAAAELTLSEGVFQWKETAEAAAEAVPAKSVFRVFFADATLAKDEKLQEQWSTIPAADAGADMLVAIRDGKLSYYRGMILGLTSEALDFHLDGDVLPIKRPRLFALWFAKPASTEAFSKPLGTLSDKAGSVFQVAKMERVTETSVTFQTRCGLKKTLAISELSRWEAFAGKVFPLRAEEAESTTWTPYLSVTGMHGAREAFYKPRTDKSLNGNLLSIGGKKFAKGLAMASRTELVFRLPDGVTRFQATVGIDDEVRPNGNVTLIIRADDRELYAKELTGKDAPEVLDLEIAGAARLTFFVDYGKNMDFADHLDLGDARLVP
ncbi:MAG: NPCBM/NEW2 domain-containing protein [Planctomycetia bacterium]|nr:NPCBM/NEW2 domain-containing protein [Planctomycetia bacterium]